MTVEDSQYKYTIAPSGFMLAFSLFITVVVFGQLFLMPILLWFKVVAMLLVGLFGALLIRKFRTARVNQLIYRPSSDQWILDGRAVRLQSNQFVTRNLIIIYFIANNGKKLTQLVPVDTMPRQQHISLRKLLISCCQSR